MARPNRARSIGGEDNLAQRIERERRRRGLSYEGLAQLMTDAGCSIQGSAIYKIEKSEPRRRVSVDELLALSRVLDTSVDDLLTPVEVLDKQRAQALLREMDDADRRFFEAIARVVRTYAELVELAAEDSELSDYVIGHRFLGSGEEINLEELRLFTLGPEMAGYDTRPYSRAVAEFYHRTIQEAGDLGTAFLKARAEGGDGGQH